MRDQRIHTPYDVGRILGPILSSKTVKTECGMRRSWGDVSTNPSKVTCDNCRTSVLTSFRARLNSLRSMKVAGDAHTEQERRDAIAGMEGAINAWESPAIRDAAAERLMNAVFGEEW